VFLNIVWQTALVALRRHWELLVVNGLALGVVVVLTLTLVPPLEAQGAAIAVLSGEAALMAMSATALLRAHGSLRLELRVAWRVAIAAAVAFGLTAISDLPGVVDMFVVTLAYFVALAALRGIPTEIRDAFAERLRHGDSSSK